MPESMRKFEAHKSYPEPQALGPELGSSLGQLNVGRQSFEQVVRSVDSYIPKNENK